MYEFEAIGTHWWLERLDGGKFTTAIKDALQAYTDQFDQRYSRFRDDSLIAQLANKGVVRHMPREMFDMLDFVRKLSKDSEGVFSPLVGNTLESLGYGKLLSDKGAQPLSAKQAQLSWSKSTIKAKKGTILDFGGFGKGWLIDEYTKILREHGVAEFIVNGGGDLYVQSEKPILFSLEHPYNPKLKIGDIKIQKGALAASSTIKRAWKSGKKTVHHIIDPTTQAPVDSDVVATFVCAHTALVADSLATILLIRPGLHEKLEELYNAETAIITKDQLV